MPMGDKPKWLLKEGGGHIFKSCDIIFRKYAPTVTVAQFVHVYACSDSAMPLLSHACLCKWCLSSFVSPSSCTLLLLWSFMLNMTSCIVV